MTPLVRPALVAIDVQAAFDVWEERGGRRNNPGAAGKIADLLAAFRNAGLPVFHIRHRGTTPDSLFQGAACLPKHEARERDGEPVLFKTVNSGFIGTELEQRLRDTDVVSVVICGATSNHCVETTTRMAGNLGFDARFVSDATWTFDRTGPDGRIQTAEAIQAMTEANLSGEFAVIVATAEVTGALGDFADSLANKHGSPRKEMRCSTKRQPVSNGQTSSN